MGSRVVSLSCHLYIMFIGLYVIYRGKFKLSFIYNVYKVYMGSRAV